MKTQKNKIVRLRIRYATAFVILLLIEVLIALFVEDSFIRPYGGDLLAVIAVYCFIRIIIPQKYKWMPLYVFILASLVECLQYFEIIRILGLEGSRFFRILIGSTFDGKDIICYGLGCLIVGIIENILSKSINCTR